MKVYHVTFADKVEQIRREGLMPFRMSNWLKAGDYSRYGEGQVYAFAHRLDAVRWAGKMDWEFHKESGSGKIVILEIDSPDTWTEDAADPLTRAGSHGPWLKRKWRVPPEQIGGVEIVTRETLAEIIIRRGNEPAAGSESLQT